MASSEADHKKERFDKAARNFLEEDRTTVNGSTEKGVVMTEDWIERTYIKRGRIDPIFFRHAKKLFEGGKPSSAGVLRTPKGQKDRDSEILRRRITERQGGAPIFSAMNFTVQNHQFPESLGPKDEVKVENGWKTHVGPGAEFCIEPPDQRVAGVDYQIVDQATAARMVEEDNTDYSKLKELTESDPFPSQQAGQYTRAQKQMDQETRKPSSPASPRQKSARLGEDCLQGQTGPTRMPGKVQRTC